MAVERAAREDQYNLRMAEHGASRNALVVLLLLYALARVLQIFPTNVPTLLIVILHVLPPAVFAFIHGRRVYGTKGIVVFMAFCLVIGSALESLSLRIGFPFGHYYFTGVMGPKLFQLPVLLSLAYVGVGYLAWVVASLIVGAPQSSRAATFIVPCVAAVVMCSWDLAMDPVWANIDRAWVWLDGGGYFGVPFSNFFGWLLTTWIFYQAFALWLRGQPHRTSDPTYSRLAVLMYGIVALGNLLVAVPSALPPSWPKTIADAAGRQWQTSDIIRASILTSVFVMVPFALIAWVRADSSRSEIKARGPRLPRTADRVSVG
jgi:putative membrane protein